MSDDVKASLRQMYAHVALAPSHLPVPSGLRESVDRIEIICRTTAEGMAWCQFLGSTEATTYLNPDGNTYIRRGWSTWHGWNVNVWAVDHPDDTTADLDDATRTALTEVVGSAT